MKILVTGGAGFIGSHLVQHFLDRGDTVSVIDDLNDYYSPDLKRQNLAEIARKGQICFHECDICDQERIPAIIRDSRPEVIVHLAARAGVRPSLEDPLLYEKVNVQGTLNILEACRKYEVPKFVFASSSSIYGNTTRVPFTEEDLAGSPISPYGATKIAGERFAYTWSHLFGIKVVCLRFFTVYGPRQRPDLAIRKFVDMIDRGRPVPMFGDGSSGRDYTYVADIVQGVAAAVALDCSYEIFNLGNSSPVTLIEMIHTLEECLGKEARIERLPFQPGDVSVTFADITRAKRMLGYSPQTTFSQGIRKFIEWYRGSR